MFTTETKFSVEQPELFLEEIYQIDPTAAVRIATKWGVPDVTNEQYNAAWRLASNQGIIPLCETCRWPILPDEPHTPCEEFEASAPSDNDYLDDEDDTVSSTEVYGRALSHFGGNHELAREATEIYPGDFI